MILRRLRPPGAVPENEFRRRCIHCGQCADVCPFGAVELVRNPLSRDFGTPVVDPRRTPCWLCMRCPPVCPTGALRDVPMTRAGMGLARIDKGRCHTYLGTIFCKTCHDKCPLRNRAIVMDMGLYPVITDACVGCGVCEKVCPTKCIDTWPPDGRRNG